MNLPQGLGPLGPSILSTFVPRCKAGRGEHSNGERVRQAKPGEGGSDELNRNLSVGVQRVRAPTGPGHAHQPEASLAWARATVTAKGR